MTSYLELKAQAENLLKQAEELRRSEIAQVIADIRATMERYELTIDDLAPTSKRAVAKTPAPIKFRGPNGETWSGRGRQPEWFKKAMSEGHSEDSFAI